MTEEFSDAVVGLNQLAASLGDMDEEEARIVALLVCDLAAYLTADDPPPVWQVHPVRMPLQ